MKKITLILGDITAIAVDAMVNTAHASLQGGSGLCYTIHKKGGAVLQQECKHLYAEHGLLADSAVEVTSAGNLPAHHVIHAVGPRWLDGTYNEEKLLYDTYKNIVLKADLIQAQTLSIPSIATGIHGFPKQRAAHLAMQAMIDILPHCTHLNTVLLVNTSVDNCQLYLQEFVKFAEKTGTVRLESLLPSRLEKLAE